MKKIIFLLIRRSGLPFLFRELVQKNKITIVLFHDIDKKSAETAFSYLSQKYNIIGLDTFLQACEEKNKEKIPAKAMIITFDDGHKGNIELLPIIKKYNLPVTIFLCAGIVDTNRHFWFQLENHPLSLPELKRRTNQERLKILSETGFTQEKEYDIPQALTKREIEELRGDVNLQSHTTFHPCLPTCNDQEAREEIAGSKEILEKNFNLNINSFSYPNGDYSDRDIQLLKKAGYQCGVTVDYGFNDMDSDLFRLKRIDVNDTGDRNELIVKSSGVWGVFEALRKGKRRSGYTKNYIE